MIHVFKKHRAESMILTIMSITIITIATTIAASFLIGNLYFKQIIEKKLIATFLAQKTLDALRDMRDNNYLLFSSDPDNCWDKLNITDVLECSSGFAEEITDGTTYYLSQSLDTAPFLKWSLEEVKSDQDGYLDLYEVDFDSNGAGDYTLYAQSAESVSGLTPIESRVFRRIIEVTRDTSGTTYEATVTISWEQSGVSFSFSLPTTIVHVY